MHIPQRATRVIAERAYSSYSPLARNCVALRVRARKSYHLFPPPPPSLFPSRNTQRRRKLSCNSTIYHVVVGWPDIFRTELRGSANETPPFLVSFPDYYYPRS